MRIFLIIFIISQLFNDCFAFIVKFGISKNWSISEKVLSNKKSKEISLESFDLESTLITRISNLQVDAAVIPITYYKNVFERQSQLSKFAINAVVGEEDVGNITLKKCSKKYQDLKTANMIADEYSAEYKWFIRKQKTNSSLKKINYYDILNLMESEKLNCDYGIIGSKRFLDKLKNADKFKFEKIGSMPLILLVEEHFLKNRYNEIQNMKKVLFQEVPQDGKHQYSFEGLRKEVFDYNFFGTKFQLERLNEIIKPI
jgi:hypothetical protein